MLDRKRDLGQSGVGAGIAGHALRALDEHGATVAATGVDDRERAFLFEEGLNLLAGQKLTDGGERYDAREALPVDVAPPRLAV